MTDDEAAVRALLTAAKVKHSAIVQVGERVMVTLVDTGKAASYAHNCIARLYAASREWDALSARDVKAGVDVLWLSRRKG